MGTILIKNGTVLTVVNENVKTFEADILVRDDRIAEIGKITSASEVAIDATNRLVMPGLVQTHVHLCQTLFQGYANDFNLGLLDWLRRKIWPLEAAHLESSLFTSALIGAIKLIRGGTTCILSMETANYTDAVFYAIESVGLRATMGKCMMDKGETVPQPLLEKTQDSIDESLNLFKKWHNKANGRLRYAFSPRFAISCSEGLLRDVAKIARDNDAIVHTHASETKQEVDAVQKETGMRNVEYLEHLGLAHDNLSLAHCVWLDENELAILNNRKVKVTHCPSSNLKLGSGIARINEMTDKGINVSLGVDAGLFNADMDAFKEMCRAISLQKLSHKQTALLSPEQAFKMATTEGARALGLENEIGSIEVGKKADIVIINNPGPGIEDTRKYRLSTILNFTEPSDVETVLIDGRFIVKDREFLTADEYEVTRAAFAEMKKLIPRAERFGFY